MKRLLIAMGVILMAISVSAQPCTWSTDQAGKVIESCGNVGINEANPGVKLQITTDDNEAVRLLRSGLGWSYIATYRGTARQGLFGDLWNNGWGLWTDPGIPLVFMTNGGYPRMLIDSSGNIGIGTQTPSERLVVAGNVSVTGNITATGSITGASVINATYQDIAEWVPASTRMTPGTVVVLNPEHTNEVKPSDEAYDTRVAGVVSANPGVILGKSADSKAMIATTGRVHVRVDATKHSIHVGDLLVTSDASGTAMFSQPIEIAGRRFHQPGTVIGKALEPLESGRGEILVLLSLQ